MSFESLDSRVFKSINQGLASPFLDIFMRLISAKEFWLSLVVLLLIWFFWKKDYVKLRYFLFTALTVGALDLLAARWLKPSFARLRPCKLDDFARVVDGCAGSLSFPSNHATNAMAVALIFTYQTGNKLWGIGAIFLAFLVGFSRVYLGVHYPSDVLAGFVLGALGAWSALLIRKKYRKRKERP